MSNDAEKVLAVDKPQVKNRKIKHGHTANNRNTRTYSTWSSMMRRCYTPSVKQYKDWGGRGISVCEHFRGFVGFLTIMGEKPDGMQIDRKNNDGNYACGACAECLRNSWPRNVYWATKFEQANNKRNNRWLEVGGVRKTVSQWAREMGVTPDLIDNRLRDGWSDTDAVMKPIMVCKRTNAAKLKAQLRLGCQNIC